MSSHDEGLVTVEEREGETFAETAAIAINEAVRLPHTFPPKGVVGAHSTVMPLLREKYAELDMEASEKAERSVYRISGCDLPMVLDAKLPINSFRLIYEGEE